MDVLHKVEADLARHVAGPTWPGGDLVTRLAAEDLVRIEGLLESHALFEEYLREHHPE